MLYFKAYNITPGSVYILVSQKLCTFIFKMI